MTQKQSDLFFTGGAGAIAVPIMTDPVVFTPELVDGTFTFNNENSTWQRDGSDMVIAIRVVATSNGTATSNPVRFRVPDNQDADSSLNSILNTSTASVSAGTFYNASSTTFHPVNPQTITSDVIQLNNAKNDTDRTLSYQEIESGDRINFKLRIPIQGWDANELVGTIGEATSTEAGLSYAPQILDGLDSTAFSDGVEADVTASTLVLEAGTYIIEATCSTRITWSSIPTFVEFNMKVTDSAGTQLTGSGSTVGCPQSASNRHRATTAHKFEITLGSQTTIKMRATVTSSGGVITERRVLSGSIKAQKIS